jgi:hypothetical protein
MAEKPTVVAAEKKVKWTIAADYLQACNCDYGCPCEFEAPPTRGSCEGMGAWRIAQGQYGDVKLDGIGFGFAARWPGPIHQGNGTLHLFIDEKATPPQRDALVQIASGQAGGMPFEIIAATVTTLGGPYFVPCQFTVNGKHGTARLGDAVAIETESIRNPVTGAEESIRIEHETGFIFKSGLCVSAKTGRVTSGELNYSWPGKAAFVAKIQYGN